MVVERKQRSDKKIRINPSFNFRTHDNIEKLARACGQTKTKMVEIIVETVFQDIKSIDNLQDRLGIDDTFRVQATEINGEIFMRYIHFKE